MINQPLRYDFDSVATTYDQWYETAEGKMYDRLEEKAVSRYLPHIAEGMKLLEVGCGTGHWSKAFAQYGFEVTGVDVSESMIRVAKEKKMSGVTFQVSDAHALPFPDNHFDVSVAITSLEFVQKAKVVLQEMVRCTRQPGGQVVVGVLNPLATINRKRRGNPDSLFAKARWFSPGELKGLLTGMGQTQLHSVAFVPRWKILLRCSPLMDLIGRSLHLPQGALMVGRVVL